MKIVSIEPTPSPNTMKINLSKSLEQGARNSYNENNIDDAPPHIKAIFEIEGIRSVYHVADFMAIDRNPRSDWEVLLPQVRAVFGEEVEEGEAEADETDHYGEVNV